MAMFRQIADTRLIQDVISANAEDRVKQETMRMRMRCGDAPGKKQASALTTSGFV
jgi:hypothetical protein